MMLDSAAARVVELGLPRACVLTDCYDPLCDEASAYANRLPQAGVAVEHRHLAGQIHGFLLMGKIVRAAAPALDEIAAVLRASFDRQ